MERDFAKSFDPFHMSSSLMRFLDLKWHHPHDARNVGDKGTLLTEKKRESMFWWDEEGERKLASTSICFIPSSKNQPVNNNQ